MAMENPNLLDQFRYFPIRSFPTRLVFCPVNGISFHYFLLHNNSWYFIELFPSWYSFYFANSFILWVGCNFILRPNCNMGCMDDGWWWWWSSFCKSQGCDTVVVDMGYIVNVHWTDGCSTKTTPAFEYIWPVTDEARLGCRTKGGYNNRGRDFGPQVRTGGVGWLSRIRNCVCWWKRARIRTSGILLCHMGS